jgi:hypothetical protein
MRREFGGMRRTYVRCSEHEMKCNVEIGVFTRPLKLGVEQLIDFHRICPHGVRFNIQIL